MGRYKWSGEPAALTHELQKGEIEHSLVSWYKFGTHDDIVSDVLISFPPVETLVTILRVPGGRKEIPDIDEIELPDLHGAREISCSLIHCIVRRRDGRDGIH